MAVKKHFILILATFSRGLTKFIKNSLKEESRLARALRWPGKVFLRFAVFPIYKFFYAAKTRLNVFFASRRGRFFYFLNKQLAIHFFIALLTLGVSLNSLRAAGLREENYGEKSLVYSLITKEEYEPLTEETLVAVPQQKVFSYLDRTATLESQRGVANEDATANVTELTMITEGGAAVIKPRIMGTVNPAEIGVSQTVTRTGIVPYTVQAGDTISTIAAKFGVSTQTVLWQNNLGPNSLIKPGNILEILPVSGVTHKIAKGDTLSAIAKKYSVETAAIVEYNNLLSVNDINSGQTLIIPGGKKIVTGIASGQLTDRGTPALSPITSLFIPPAEAIAESGFLWPTSVRRITQYYSWRHTGLDIAGPTGTPLYASEGGTIIRSGWTNGYGYNVVIDHGNGYKTLYGHASKLFVNAGDTVVKGQTVAAMGSTGWSTGPHLHFEIIYKGAKQNPLSYIK